MLKRTSLSYLTFLFLLRCNFFWGEWNPVPRVCQAGTLPPSPFPRAWAYVTSCIVPVASFVSWQLSSPHPSVLPPCRLFTLENRASPTPGTARFVACYCLPHFPYWPSSLPLAAMGCSGSLLPLSSLRGHVPSSTSSAVSDWPALCSSKYAPCKVTHLSFPVCASGIQYPHRMAVTSFGPRTSSSQGETLYL